MPSILNKSLSPSVVKTALDMVSSAEFNKSVMPDQASVLDAMLFNQDSADSSAVITEVFGGIPMWDATAEEVALTRRAGRVKDQQTFSVVDYKVSIPITREFMRDNKWNLVAKQVRDAADKGVVTREQKGMALFRGGFTTTLTNDGAALFSDSHTTVSGDTVDNKSTSALDDTSLNTGLTALAEQKDQSGVVVGRRAKVLLVPPALYKQAVILTDSSLRPGTANNDANVYSSKYGLVVKQSPYLGAANSGGSDTAWFLLSDMHSIYRWVREGFNTDYIGPEYSVNDEAAYKMRFAEVFGATQFDGVWGSTGV